MTQDPASRMRFLLQPGVERGHFVGQDIAPGLLHDSSFISALATSSFNGSVFTAGTGIFTGGLEIPVTGGSSMTGITGSLFWDTTKNYLVVYNGTSWIGITGTAVTP
jgi:hypothetical protein